MISSGLRLIDSSAPDKQGLIGQVVEFEHRFTWEELNQTVAFIVDPD